MSDGVSPAVIMKSLGGIDFPASRADIVGYAKQQGAPGEVISILNQIQDKEYESAADLMKEIGRVE